MRDGVPWGAWMEAFVARQPVFDRRGNVYGYELLYRSGLQNVFDHLQPDVASASVIANGFSLLGLDTLTAGKRAFINFTRDTLLNEYALILPNTAIVVEILEDVEPDDAIQKACRKLKARGYQLALDDVVLADPRHPLLPLVDLIKVDLRQAATDAAGQIAALAARHGVRTLAEKVESQEELARTRALGYTYFQGYFFSKPVILSGKDIPAFDLSRLRLLQAIHRGDVDFDEIERVLKVEVGLTYKLLRFINSALFSLPHRITSIKQALVMLGAAGLRKWASIVVLADLGQDKPRELTVHCVLRARFCEQLALRSRLRQRSNDLFIAGLFSMIDAFLCRPLAEILEALPINDEIKTVLLGGSSDLRDVYDLALAHERARWDRVAAQVRTLGIRDSDVGEAYRDAVQWANDTATAA